ncbi:hypothetical protein EHQ61_00735 [Leptospira wolffii]|uniref:hypothetical protein n=1 Tax=Leptospira wolffii TaxID=409998 RepID=UPI0010832E09|nr:hypothetical protein [Leptospira wolffii]TGL55269.1 hypothetical protein EHQ61_00735 [Leptospira wolffii]
MEHYKIQIAKGRIQLEISSHDRDWVENKFKELSEILNNETTDEDPEGFREPKPKKGKASLMKIPINEFYRKYIHEKKISSRPDIATIFVFYLSKYEDKKEIPANDIKELFKDVQYPGWNGINISDVLNKAKRKAFLNSVNNNWTLTITGEDYVMNLLSENE